VSALRVGSLFTGYGGLDIAVGGDLAWYAEIEPAACQVLAHYYPGVVNLGDITAINWADVEPVDVITGGYPCQPFSHAGNRKGKNDVRHLWPNVLDAIRAIRPRYAILENVSGHLTLGFADVLADLAEIGWDAEWGTYRASDVGAPHRRERIFIVAINPNNDGRFATKRGRSVREGTVTRRQQQHEVEQRELARGSDPLIAYATRGIGGEGQGRGLSESEKATGLATHSGDIATDTDNSRSTDKSFTRQSQKRSTKSDFDTTADTINNGLQHAIERMDARQGQAATPRHQRDAADTAVTFGGESALQGTKQGQLRGHSGIVWGKYAPAIARWESVLERAAPEPTIERNDKRRLNPQFVEWMMGLPDGWVTGHGLSAAKELKMLGNGVVPQQAHAAITQLMQRATP
jgi:DNA (cytosine-5)-methyltransferase 1